MGTIDRVIERHAVTMTCDECHVSETVVYDDIGEFHRGDPAEFGFKHEWAQVLLVAGSGESMVFCSKTCLENYGTGLARRYYPTKGTTKLQVVV